jgi:hypothetical protein
MNCFLIRTEMSNCEQFSCPKLTKSAAKAFCSAKSRTSRERNLMDQSATVDNSALLAGNSTVDGSREPVD